MDQDRVYFPPDVTRRHGEPAGALKPYDACAELVANLLPVVDYSRLDTVLGKFERGNISGWAGSDYQYVIQVIHSGRGCAAPGGTGAVQNFRILAQCLFRRQAGTDFGACINSVGSPLACTVTAQPSYRRRPVSRG